MRHRVVAFLGIACALAGAPFWLACRQVDGGGTTGESLGTFVVRGTLEENGCAPGLDPIDPLEFRVDLARDHGSLSWRMPGGAPALGRIEADGEFRLRTSQEVEAWPADPANEVRGCWLTQVETVEGTIVGLPEAADGGLADGGAADGGAADAGVPQDEREDASFEAVNRIEIVPVAGSDCTPLLLVNGGSFPTLPCTARYELRGSLAP